MRFPGTSTRAVAKERVLLATSAGRASQDDHRSEAVGRDIVEAARASFRPDESTSTIPGPPDAQLVPRGSASFVARIKAVLAA